MIRSFIDRAHMLSTINRVFDEDDMLMTKRNTAYGQCLGFFNRSEKLVGVGSVAMYGDELHIYIFEISEEYQGEGYGKKFFYDLIHLYNPSVITLDPLDDEAESFWKYLGFEWGETADGEKCMILKLI